jgi:hypothetical protein
MTTDTAPGALATGAWRLDPTRSSAEFHVGDVYGLITVEGRFDRDDGTPAVALVIDAVSLEADAPELAGDTLNLSGLVFAAGRHVPLEIDAAVTATGEIEATAVFDQRRLVVRGRLVGP